MAEHAPQPQPEFDALEAARQVADVSDEQLRFNEMVGGPGSRDPLSPEEHRQAARDMVHYLEQRPGAEAGAGQAEGDLLSGQLRHMSTGQAMLARAEDTFPDHEHYNATHDSEGRPLAYEGLGTAELVQRWAESEANEDRTTASNIQDVLQDRLIDSGISAEMIDTLYQRKEKAKAALLAERGEGEKPEPPAGPEPTPEPSPEPEPEDEGDEPEAPEPDDDDLDVPDFMKEPKSPSPGPDHPARGRAKVPEPSPAPNPEDRGDVRPNPFEDEPDLDFDPDHRDLPDNEDPYADSAELAAERRRAFERYQAGRRDFAAMSPEDLLGIDVDEARANMDRDTFDAFMDQRDLVEVLPPAEQRPRRSFGQWLGDAYRGITNPAGETPVVQWARKLKWFGGGAPTAEGEAHAKAMDARDEAEYEAEDLSAAELRRAAVVREATGVALGETVAPQEERPRRIPRLPRRRQRPDREPELRPVRPPAGYRPRGRLDLERFDDDEI